MKARFKASFAKDLRGIRDRNLLKQIRAIIDQVEQAQSPQEISNLRKLRGKGTYYRIRVGHIRLGLIIVGLRDHSAGLDSKDYRFF